MLLGDARFLSGFLPSANFKGINVNPYNSIINGK